MPLPFLLGPLAACLVTALMGAQLSGPPTPWLNGIRTVLGVAAGSSVSPALMDQLPQTLASASLVPLFLIASLLLGYPFFRRVAGFDKPTAYFATMPGGFAEMILFGAEKGGDIRALSLVHATRILTLVSLTPFLISLYVDVDLSAAPGVPVRDIPVSDLLIMLVCAVAGYHGARRIGMFGASVLGPMILSAAASLTGLIENRPPTEALILAQFIIGISIGSHYVGVTRDELRRVVSASVGYALILAVLTVIFGEIVYLLGINDLLHGILAFAPGGQPEMVMLAILTGADITYVIFHHVLRLLLVMSLTPVLARWLA
jgi:membrane AbrB-like protein